MSYSYTFTPFVLDVANRRLTNDGMPVKLSPKAFELLIALVKRPQRLVTKEELLADVWPGTFVEEGNLAVKIAELRRALVDPSGHSYIETVPKHGYRFAADVSEAIAPAGMAINAVVDVPVPTVDVSAVPAAIDAVLASPRGASRGRSMLIATVFFVASSAIGAYVVSRSQVAADSGVRSLVVMPFRAIDPAASQTYLGSGMADAINSRLTGLAALRVSPTAAVRENEDPFEAGRRLSLDAVLTGSVQHAGADLRVTAQLSRVADGGQLWAGRFDEKFTDIFAVQDAIAERIATRLLSELTTVDRAALTRPSVTNAGAYDMYLRAREQWSRRTPEAVRTAIRMYEQAIALDPAFALAYAGLADCYNISHSGIPARTRFPLARAAAEKALSLDPNSAEAHNSLAFTLYKFEYAWDRSIARFQRSIALNPRYGLARYWYAELLGRLGRYPEAIAEFKRALELLPDSPAIRLTMASVLLDAGEIAEARAMVEAGLALDPKAPRLLLEMSEVLAREGRLDESAELRWRGLLLQGTPQAEVNRMQAAYRTGGLRGVTDVRIAILLEQLQTADAEHVPGGIPGQLAVEYARAGDRDRSLYWANRAADQKDDAPVFFKSEHAYDFMRDDPRFKALLRKVGLPE